HGPTERRGGTSNEEHAEVRQKHHREKRREGFTDEERALREVACDCSACKSGSWGSQREALEAWRTLVVSSPEADAARPGASEGADRLIARAWLSALSSADSNLASAARKLFDRARTKMLVGAGPTPT